MLRERGRGLNIQERLWLLSAFFHCAECEVFFSYIHGGFESCLLGLICVYIALTISAFIKGHGS